jgi:hypothetical protein
LSLVNAVIKPSLTRPLSNLLTLAMRQLGLQPETLEAKCMHSRGGLREAFYIRPSGEHRFTTLDDFSEISLARLSADGFKPCALVETSASNFQVWLKHPRTFPKLLGAFAAQTLAERYDADLKLAQIPSKREMATILECEVNSARAFRPRNGLWVSAESNGNNVECSTFCASSVPRPDAPAAMPEDSGNAVVCIVPTEHLIEMIHLLPDRQVPHLVLQPHERTSQP